LAVVHSREALVRSRTKMINHVRGTVKSFGYRLPKCSAPSFHKKVPGQLPSELAEVLGPIVETVGSLTEKIKDYDRRIEELAAERYPETRLLRQVSGVGSLTALTFVLTLEDPQRFAESRSVGAYYLGLAPGIDQSGEQDPQKRISGEGGEGEEMLRRRLLVSSAHYILGPFAPDSDLRRHGEKIAQRGGKNAKKRAVVAVARKLSVLLHGLWVSGEVYEALRNARCLEVQGEEVA
jgi:transposase